MQSRGPERQSPLRGTEKQKVCDQDLPGKGEGTSWAPEKGGGWSPFSSERSPERLEARGRSWGGAERLDHASGAWRD